MGYPSRRRAPMRLGRPYGSINVLKSLVPYLCLTTSEDRRSMDDIKATPSTPAQDPTGLFGCRGEAPGPSGGWGDCYDPGVGLDGTHGARQDSSPTARHRTSFGPSTVVSKPLPLRDSPFGSPSVLPPLCTPREHPPPRRDVSRFFFKVFLLVVGGSGP